MSKAKLKTLYQNIGGEKKLERIVNEFYRRMSQDILIGFFFDGKDIDVIATKQKEFLMTAMGARKLFTGKNPAVAHRDLPPILRGHFDRRMVILREVLKDFGLSEPDIQTWLTFENAFREVIESPDEPLS